MTAAIDAFILVILTLLTEWLVLKPIRTGAQLAQSRTAMMEASRRNSEALVAMGMLPHPWSGGSRSMRITSQATGM
jgi:ABC-type protease/lipase transport system fused ATPase/permease subunit